MASEGTTTAPDALQTKDVKPGRRQEELTDANMEVANFTSSSVDIGVWDNSAMDDTFSSQTVNPGKTAMGYVSASSWKPGQSSFRIDFNHDHGIKIEIGSGVYDTDAQPDSFWDGKIAVVLAPGKPLSGGADYNLFFLVCEGIIPPLINSFLKANANALTKYINAWQPSYTWSGVQFTLAQLDFNDNCISCTAGGVYETSPKSNMYNASVVVSVSSVSLSGTASYAGISGGFEFSFKGFSAMCNAEIDASGNTPSVNVSRFQTSLKNGDVSGSILGILELLFPSIIPLVASLTAYRIAGCLNTYLNDAIKDAINDAIKSFLPTSASFQPATETTKAGEPAQTDAAPKLRFNGSYSTWMSDSSIQRRCLKDIRLPATHDSGTYDLSNTLSTIKYPDIALLWALSPDSAPANGKNPFSWPPSESSPLYLGKAMYDFLMSKIVNNTAKTQDCNVKQQLEAGIRCFDLRLYYDERNGGGFYVQHAVRGPKVNDLLRQVASFMDEHPNSGELIFLHISHANFSDYSSVATTLSTIVQNAIGASRIFFKSGNPFDFQSLGSQTLSSITGGKPKVMIVNQDTSYTFPSSSKIITNSSGFASRPFDPSHSVSEMGSKEGNALQQNTKPMYYVNWALAQSIPDITRMVMALLAGRDVWMLQEYAKVANASLGWFFSTYAKWSQAVGVDWLRDSNDGVSAASRIVDTNF